MAARTIVARAPSRIDVGGGWTDVPPYPAEQGGFVCNLAIARYAKVTLREGPPAPDTEVSSLTRAALRRAAVDSVTVAIESDFPIGAGLGGSSAAGVALAGALAAWTGETLSPTGLAERSRATETEDMRIAGGRQDHYAAVLGGALALTFTGDACSAAPIALPPGVASELPRRCLLFHTGESRISARAINLVLDAYKRRDPRVTTSLREMKACALRMADALRRGAIDDLGSLLREHWEFQSALHPDITTGRIEAVKRAAYDAGALGLKALGASGGGCVVVVASADGVDELRAAIRPLAEELPYAVAPRGFELLEQRDG